LKEFPKCSSSIVDSDGRLPFRFAIVTVDGNNFFPVALNPTDSARDEGIRNHDIIMSINGISMMNKAFSEVWDHVKGNPGTKCQIKVGRTGETVDMVIRRVNLSEVK
jgi:C-terminal processing protease CtpA/Prc